MEGIAEFWSFYVGPECLADTHSAIDFRGTVKVVLMSLKIAHF